MVRREGMHCLKLGVVGLAAVNWGDGTGQVQQVSSPFASWAASTGASCGSSGCGGGYSARPHHGGGGPHYRARYPRVLVSLLPAHLLPPVARHPRLESGHATPQRK